MKEIYKLEGRINTEASFFSLLSVPKGRKPIKKRKEEAEADIEEGRKIEICGKE